MIKVNRHTITTKTLEVTRTQEEKIAAIADVGTILDKRIRNRNGIMHQNYPKWNGTFFMH